MAIRIQDLTKKNYDQSSGHSVPHFSVSCPSWWNSSEQKILQSLPKISSPKVESPHQFFHDGKYLGLQLADQESSSAQSIGQSHCEVSGVGGVDSQDQCISSESGQDESCGKGVEGQMKPVFPLSNSEIVFNQQHAYYNQSMAHTPYPYGDHYFGGLFTPYGPQTQALIQPQIGSLMMGIAPARVPLPLDPAEDGPIYVNPKQYYGILRRRQSRAKLLTQNKLVKTRKPYLHESRHLHAVNRVRGSGGRFLSSKKLQQADPTSISSARGISDTNHFHKRNTTSEFEGHSGTMEHVASVTSCSEITSVSNSEFILQQAERGFSAIQNHGRLVCSEMQHCASVAR